MSIVNEQYHFLHSGIHEYELSYHHLCLVFIIFTFPCAEGKFPRVCTSLTSLKNKKCCPIPKGFSAPCGNDGNRGTCQEFIIHDCSFTYSHYQPFQKDDERNNWPHSLYHKTRKCNSNFAVCYCSKCEFGYYGKDWAHKKTLTRKISSSCQPRRGINTYILTCPVTTSAIMW